MKCTFAACLSLLVLIITQSGCFSQQEITREELSPQEKHISEVLTVSQEVFVFRKDARGRLGMVQDSAIVGTLDNGMEVIIPMSRVRRINLLRRDTGSTVIWTVGVVAIAGVIVLLVMIPRLP